MGRNWSDAGKYAGTGAATGAALGSVVGPWGTAIGAAGGALIGGIGGFIGGTIADDNAEREQEAAKQRQLKEQERARKRALKEYMLGEAMALDGNATANRAEYFKMGMGDMSRAQQDQRQGLQRAIDESNETDPAAFAQLAGAGARVAQTSYNAFNQPGAMPAPSAQIAAPGGAGGGFGGTVNPANLAAIPPPQYTPSKIADPSLSPEVQEGFDTTNLAAIRRGRREGF